MTEQTAQQDVLAAAAALVDAFGRHDTEAYFAAFRPDATFCFHTHPVPLRTRAAYEALWASWEADGFAVLGCTSSEQHVQLLGGAGDGAEDVAVFTHRVATRLRLAEGEPEESLDERETIVFSRGDDGWRAVHEHLSPVPA
jgi:ketosteroid isomerase-like protein